MVTQKVETTNEKAVTRRQVAREARKMRANGVSNQDVLTWICEKSGYISQATGQALTRGGALSVLYKQSKRISRRRRKSNPKSVTPPPVTKGLRLSTEFIAAVSGLSTSADEKLALIQLVAGV